MDFNPIIELIKSNIEKPVNEIFILIINELKVSLSFTNFQVLYNIINKNKTLDNEVIIDIYNNFVLNTINKNVIKETKKKYYELDYTYEFFKYLSNFVMIYFQPKKIVLLWNNKDKNPNIDTMIHSVITDSDSLYKKLSDKIEEVDNKIIVEVNLEELMEHSFEHFNTIKKNIKYSYFDYFCRMIGVEITNHRSTIPFNCQVDLTNSKLFYTIRGIPVKGDIFIKEKKFKIEDFASIGKFLSKEIMRYPNSKIYINILSKLLTKTSLLDLIKSNDKIFTLISNNFIFFDEYIPKPITVTKCQHTIFIEEDRLDIVQSEFLITQNDLPVCRVCGEIIYLFLETDTSVKYSKKTGQVIQTQVQENIFKIEPYSNFIQVISVVGIVKDLYMFSMGKIISFQLNNIYRLVIDWVLYLNDNRINLEKTYANLIKESDFFILRSTLNIFSLDFNLKDKYSQYKHKNIYFIILIILMLNTNFIVYLDVINKNAKLKQKKNFLDVMEFILDKIFKNKNLNLEIKGLRPMLNAYIDIFNEELREIFDRFIKNWDSNISKKTITVKIENDEVSKPNNKVVNKFYNFGKFRLTNPTGINLSSSLFIEDLNLIAKDLIIDKIKAKKWDINYLFDKTEINKYDCEVLSFNDNFFLSYKNKLISNFQVKVSNEKISEFFFQRSYYNHLTIDQEKVYDDLFTFGLQYKKKIIVTIEIDSLDTLLSILEIIVS